MGDYNGRTQQKDKYRRWRFSVCGRRGPVLGWQGWKLTYKVITKNEMFYFLAIKKKSELSIMNPVANLWGHWSGVGGIARTAATMLACPDSLFCERRGERPNLPLFCYLYVLSQVDSRWRLSWVVSYLPSRPPFYGRHRQSKLRACTSLILELTNPGLLDEVA